MTEILFECWDDSHVVLLGTAVLPANFEADFIHTPVSPEALGRLLVPAAVAFQIQVKQICINERNMLNAGPIPGAFFTEFTNDAHVLSLGTINVGEKIVVTVENISDEDATVSLFGERTDVPN